MAKVLELAAQGEGKTAGFASPRVAPKRRTSKRKHGLKSMCLHRSRQEIREISEYFPKLPICSDVFQKLGEMQQKIPFQGIQGKSAGESPFFWQFFHKNFILNQKYPQSGSKNKGTQSASPAYPCQREAG